MNKQNVWEKKRKFNQAEENANDDDDEQIKKTLNFFDSILDPYLTDDNPTQKSNDSAINQNVNTSSSSASSSSSHVRRQISEHSLHQIPSIPSKSKLSSSSRPLRTTATSTEDLSNIPTQLHLSNFIKKTNLLSANGASASLIDLSTIDKVPRFRFVPPSVSNLTLKEEPEIEPEFHLKTISNNQISLNPSTTKPSHKIVKPVVIIPSVPRSAPINRLTETNIHHQNGNSAFKPHRSTKNGVSSKIQQIKRTESIQKPNVQVALSNSDYPSAQRQQQQQQQSKPQYHQSMLNLSSPEPVHTSRVAPRTSYQSNKMSGHYPSRPIIYGDRIIRWIEQVNNTSSINGLVQSENRIQQQNYPYGSYVSTNNGMPPSVNHRRPQTYYNPQKYQSSQHPIPVQSVYVASAPVTRNNVYNFNQNHLSSRDGQSKRHSHRQNSTITTYL